MLSWIWAAVVAAALGVMAVSPGEANARPRYFFGAGYYPTYGYGYSPYYSSAYSYYPGYSYGYTPYYSSSGYTGYPAYSGYVGGYYPSGVGVYSSPYYSTGIGGLSFGYSSGSRPWR
jgi:hypothetical protein